MLKAVEVVEAVVAAVDHHHPIMAVAAAVGPVEKYFKACSML
jgi:hypothetical protein